MLKPLFITILSFALLLSGCSSNNSSDDVSSIKNSSESLQYRLDKDEFIDALSEKFDIFDSISMLHIADVPNEENNTTISTYLINYDFIVDDLLIDTYQYHLSVSCYNDNKIKSIDISAHYDDAIISFAHPFVYYVITTLNNDADFDLTTFSEKYKLDSFDDIFENDVVGEEEKFRVFKSVNGEYVSVYISMK